MSQGDSKGFTLLESLVAMGLLAIMLASLVPVLFVFLKANTRNEVRSGAVAAAQQSMEELRQQDPTTMPDEGATEPQVVSVDRRDFEVVRWYCLAPEYCGDDSRHVLVEVNLGGKTVYSVESVYTQLR
jgi:prepilin-type N-terminal cleavage/methylation domain-containing protein